MKVIAFSLWGDNPKYTVGAVRNAALAAELFPDWVCRFYIGDGVPDKTLGLLANLDNVELAEIPVGFEGWKGMFSRFAPAGEPEVEVMLSRDCDSRLSERERDAVNEWLESDCTFHIIRDHPWHGAAILGGTWGAKFGAVPQMNQWIADWTAEDRWQCDQDFLKAVVYPHVIRNAMVHASFHAIEPHARPFPSPRRGLEFVGQVFDENDQTVQEHLEVLRKAL